MRNTRNVLLMCGAVAMMACGMPPEETRRAVGDELSGEIEQVQQAVLQASPFFVGSYAATLVPKQMKKQDELAPLLPPWLDFGPTILTSNLSKHPVTFHHQHYLSIGIYPGPAGPNEWNELNPGYMLDLKIKDGWTITCPGFTDLGERFSFIPVSFTDSETALGGAALFGLNMHLGTIESDYATFPSSYHAEREDAPSIVYDAEFGPAEGLTASGQANFADLLASLNAPVFGINAATGQPVIHDTEWVDGTPETLLSVTSADISASASHLGDSFTHEQVGINDERLGAVFLQSNFVSTFGYNCTAIPPTP